MPSKNSSCRRALFQLLFTEGLKLYAPLEKINQHCNRICYIDITAPVAISDWKTNQRPPLTEEISRKADRTDESNLSASADVPTAPLRRLKTLSCSRGPGTSRNPAP